MRKLRISITALAASAALFGTAYAQQSNPVTSNPPAGTVGRNSETSPGTPNVQNTSPDRPPAGVNQPPANGVGSRGINGEPPNAGGVTPVPNIKSLDKQGRGGQEN